MSIALKPVATFAVNGSNIFEGTYNGVYISKDNEVNWTEINNGLTNKIIRALIVSGTNILAGTGGGAVWKRQLAEMVSGVADGTTRKPSVFALKQNYPNPFNPSTTISYALPKESNILFNVYISLGQFVGQLKNGVEKAGSRCIEFNSSGLPSGVYLYTPQAGDLIETKKLIIMK